MEDLYQEFRDVAAFLVVYINEAHPSDGFSANKDAARRIPNHRNYDQRCAAATQMLDETLTSIPCLIDDMDNSTDIAYRAWPDKVFVINRDGIVAIAGADGPYGFEPALKETRAWLEQLRDTGREPEVVHGKAADFSTVLMGELHPDGPQDEYLEKIDRARNAARQAMPEAKTGLPDAAPRQTALAERSSGLVTSTGDSKVATETKVSLALVNTLCFVLAGVLLAAGWFALTRLNNPDPG